MKVFIMTQVQKDVLTVLEVLYTGIFQRWKLAVWEKNGYIMLFKEIFCSGMLVEFCISKAIIHCKSSAI